MMRQLYIIVCTLLLATFSSTLDADIVRDWNNVVLDTIRDDGAPPPQASRTLAMTHIAMYDALNSIDRQYSPYKVDLTAPLNTSHEAAAASAAHSVLTSLYPAYSSVYDAALLQSLSVIPDGQSKLDGISLGQYVAGEIVNWRASDGSNNVVTYTPGTGQGQWRPTPPGYAPALLPQWGQVTPFAIPYGSVYRIDGPPALDTVAYAQDHNEVKLLGDKNSLARTPEQTEIAYFWESKKGTATPPGHWNQIAQVVSLSEGNDLMQNARMFALLNISLADAAIAAWDCKYEFDFWRPITAIREIDENINPLITPVSDWEPLLATPPFPECVSGHSTFSGAGAKALERFFGRDDIPFTVGSDDLPGIYRYYGSFSEAAIESGLSRIYGGIHFEFSDMPAIDMGYNIGDYAFDNYMQPVVPEWSSFWLAGSALLGIPVLRSRRRSR